MVVILHRFCAKNEAHGATIIDMLSNNRRSTKEHEREWGAVARRPLPSRMTP